jgi:SAM-dependent methyltransferase
MKDNLKSIIKDVFSEKYYPKLADLYVRFKYSVIRFHCPFCKGSFGKLLPAGYYLPVLKQNMVIGGGYRLDALCPNCRSSDRERLVYLYLRTRTDLFQNGLRLLHIAPEHNLQKVLRAHPSIDYISADLNSPAAMVAMDIGDIPYGDSSFDVIICNHVLEHIQDDKKAMSELYRVLKPSGWAILQVPVSLTLSRTFEDPSAVTPERRETLFGQCDHVRIYARDYRNRLESVGFFVEIFDPRKGFSTLVNYRNALLKREKIYVCKKERAHN